MRITNHSRKIDTNGRIVIPAPLREELNLTTGDECQFVVEEIEGVTYLCIPCPKAESEVEKAQRILREAGLL